MSDLWTGHRTAWLCLQFVAGVLNAYGMIANLPEGHSFSAAICAFCVYVTARWPMPPPTRPKERQ